MIIGSKLIFKKHLTSTNTFALSLLKEKQQKEGTIVYTNFQTGGRGQKGNGWESEDGKNLLISIILHPTSVAPSEQFIISKAISLGVYDFVGEYTDGVQIKWPNDIYAGNDKIAGILIENSIMSSKIENCVAGIGLNINQGIFRSGAPNPVSLYLLTGKIFELADCLKKLADKLDIRYNQLRSGEYAELNADYLSGLYRYKEWSFYYDKSGSFEGRIISITPAGMLQVEDRNGIIRDYSFGEVDFIL